MVPMSAGCRYDHRVPLTDVVLPELFRVIDLLGVLLNGILGAMVAREYKLDIIGLVSLAIASALGGGMVRDLLLQAGPPVAIADPAYLGVACAGALFVYLFWPRGPVWKYTSVVLDGLVLGTWSATGAIKTLAAGFGWEAALLLGVMTAVGGGAIRDICVGRIPGIFGGSPLYATPAIASSVLAVIAFKLGVPNMGMIACTIVGCAFTVLAWARRWMLPRVDDHLEFTLTSEQLRKLLRRARVIGEARGRRDEQQRQDERTVVLGEGGEDQQAASPSGEE